MKKLFFVLAFIVSLAAVGFSQEASFYTFFVNIVSEQFRYPLVGFVNIAQGNHNSPQIGLVNWNTKDFSGFQAGLINTTGGSLSGAQVGLVNVSEKRLRGFQLGLINSADSIEDGIPIGLISIVRNGGYHAIEYSFSEFHPVNIGIKLGVDKFYTTIIAAYNPIEGAALENFATGMGLGLIIPINTHLFINPELNYLFTPFGNITNSILSFVPYFGYNITKNISVLIAPSITWVHNFGEDDLIKPFFKIVSNDINERNSIAVGVRASLRVRF
jgi:hypothetical protein